MPCIDNCLGSLSQHEVTIQVEQEHSDHNVCPPLCNCLCCNTTVSVTNNYSLNTSFNSLNCVSSATLDLTSFSLIPSSPPPKA